METSSSFESLSSAIWGQIEIQYTADLIWVVSQKIMIDVTTIFMESIRVKEKTMARMIVISYFSSLAFLHSDGNKAKNLASYDFKDCVGDLTYVKLDCNLDGSAIDTRIF